MADPPMENNAPIFRGPVNLFFLRTTCGPRKTTQTSPHCIQVSQTCITQRNDNVRIELLLNRSPNTL